MDTKIERYQRMIDAETQEMIKDRVAEIQAKNPSLSFVEAYNQLAMDRPGLFKDSRDVTEIDRDQRISDACFELMAKNPGMTFSTACSLLAMTRPDLFLGFKGPAMEKEEKVREQQAQIQAEIDKMREKEPHLTYPLAFNRLMKEKPELFKFEGMEGGEN
jgi:hypothetical protein